VSTQVAALYPGGSAPAKLRRFAVVVRVLAKMIRLRLRHWKLTTPRSV
jgi:hypothetical protein